MDKFDFCLHYNNSDLTVSSLRILENIVAHSTISTMQPDEQVVKGLLKSGMNQMKLCVCRCEQYKIDELCFVLILGWLEYIINLVNTKLRQYNCDARNWKIINKSNWWSYEIKGLNGNINSIPLTQWRK